MENGSQHSVECFFGTKPNGIYRKNGKLGRNKWAEQCDQVVAFQDICTQKICGFSPTEIRLGYSLETRGPWKPILGEASKDSINRCTVRVFMQVKGKLRDVNWGGRGKTRDVFMSSLGRNGLRG